MTGMMPVVELTVRAARADDPAWDLLYESAAPYYDVYAGGGERARRILRAVYPRGGHTASWQVCRVAELDGRLAGVLAGFPVAEGDRLAARFVAITLPRVPAWRWPAVLRHLRAAGRMAPSPPGRSWYVDAVAVAPDLRRHGVATALLADAEATARRRRASGVALDTGLANHPARRLYEHHGFDRREVRHAPDDRTARAIGGPGFVSYFKPAG